MQCLIKHVYNFLLKASVQKLLAMTEKIKIKSGLHICLDAYFLTGSCRVLKLSEYSSNVWSHLQKKFHGDLKCLQMCNFLLKVSVQKLSALKENKINSELLSCFLFINWKLYSSKNFQNILLTSEAICRRNFMEIWSACKCVILPLMQWRKNRALYILYAIQLVSIHFT